MRTTAAALLIALSLTGLAACGDDEGDATGADGRKVAASTDDFCAAITDFASAAKNDDWSALRQAADRLEDAGLPKDAPDDAGDGYDVILEVVRTYDSNDEVEKNITDAQDDHVEALLTYTDDTCAQPSMAPNEGGSGPSDEPSS
ncbi:hypothetical protein EKO23_08665 [Nocardioides guangzhouensis]|uniref:Lipoprotein n=1 Tax=Nocardioides guangzhouensis TaxID=2497878 RepID=A0A4Q4ZH96_9ACTN|nr:hypothetical protein [Nocardioides guangzhouensis]RYP86724.1 hypothetical protein EKO23_08665 [Nocardioides guangzhouensis]